MKKLLSLALILSLLLSCGVFASPDAVVSESADEALAEVSGVEETAELAAEQILFSTGFDSESDAGYTSFNNTVSGTVDVKSWLESYTDSANVTKNGVLSYKFGHTNANSWVYAGIGVPLEPGKTYTISFSAVVPASSGNMFVVNAPIPSGANKQISIYTPTADGKWHDYSFKYTCKATGNLATATAENFKNASLAIGGKNTNEKTYYISDFKIAEVVGSYDTEAEVPYDLENDSNYVNGNVPKNFGSFTGTIAPSVENGSLNFTMASWNCVGFALNLEEDQTYRLKTEFDASAASGTLGTYYLVVQAKCSNGHAVQYQLSNSAGSTFKYDNFITLSASKFTKSKSCTDDCALSKILGVAVTCQNSTNISIKSFSIEQTSVPSKKIFTEDNKNVFENGGFETSEVEIFPVVDTSSSFSFVTGADNVKDGDQALMVSPGASNAWVNMGANVEWQIDRKYKYEFDIKVLNYANGAEITDGTPELYSLVYFPDANAKNSKNQHSDLINTEIPVGEWQHIEGEINIDALTFNSTSTKVSGIASDADLTDGAFAIFFKPEGNQNYNYIIDNISLVRLPYETDIDVSYDFDNTARVFGTQWVLNNVDKKFGVGINDIAAEISEDPTDSENKVLKVTQNVAWGAVAFHMPLAENKVYTYSYDIYVADNSTNYGTNFVFNDDLSAQKKISHPQASTTSIPANTWTHVTGSFCPVKADKKSGQTLVAEDANLGENYFSIYTYVKSTFYIDNLVIKSYSSMEDYEFETTYKPTTDTENFSVRADENSGIRTFASVTHEQRGGCTEYGFIVALTDTLAANGNEELTFESKSKFVSGVSYGEDNGTKVDKIYRADGDKTIFAAVFTGITEANYKKALTFRPYLKVNYPNGGEKVVYGEAISKSVYDVVLLLNNADSIAGMTKAQIEFCKKVIPSFGE